MPIDLPPTPKLWLPPKPAIIRPAPDIRVPSMLGITMLSRMSMARSKFVAAGGGAPQYSNLTYRSNTKNISWVSDAITVSGGAIGTAASDRYVIAAMVSRKSGGATVSSATIGGVSATSVGVSNLEGGYHGVMYIANVTTGTTADIVFNRSSADMVNGASVAWWTVNMSSITRHDVGTIADNGFANTVAVASVDIPVLGFAVGMMFLGTNGATHSINSGFTEDSEDSTSACSVGFVHLESAGGFSGTVTSTFSDTDNGSGIIASWKGDGT